MTITQHEHDVTNWEDTLPARLLSYTTIVIINK